MENKYEFQPPRQFGLAFHAVAVIGLITVSVWGFWQASRSSLGPIFLLSLLPGLISLGLLPMLVYRAYSLITSSYVIHRDGIKLQWGLRTESIPMDAILWVSPCHLLKQALPMPWLRWPGAVLGVRRLADGSQVEFIASSNEPQIAIATQASLYVISPLEPDFFVDVFNRYWELGSLTPAQPYSMHPSFALVQVWEQTLARYVLLVGLIANLVLLSWVSLITPLYPSINLGFISGDEPVPAVRLVLLPILSIFFFIVDFLLGLFFFRRSKNQLVFTASTALKTEEVQDIPGLIKRDASLVSGQVLAYLLWSSGALSALLFILAVFFILRAAG